jgi:hypothetical protein
MTVPPVDDDVAVFAHTSHFLDTTRVITQQLLVVHSVPREAAGSMGASRMVCQNYEGHHDADGLAGHKSWRTTQTTTRRYKISLLSIF